MSNPVVSDPVEKVRQIAEMSWSTSEHAIAATYLLRTLADPGCEETLRALTLQLFRRNPMMSDVELSIEISRELVRTLCAAAVGGGDV